ncbi:MAG: DUF4433 domain-containing protein [Actinomycetota bacterium]|nr:DUF4433 domain-containing protein [Actinomycetota bacterium]
MTTPRRGLLFHFTHVSNLASIAASGLSSDNDPAFGPITDVGSQDIKRQRRSREVPLPPGGVVADYVPFYFAARSPMLGSIHTGRVRTYTGGQDDIVYLVSAIERIVEAALPFVFTDRNAVYDYARFGNSEAQIGEFVDWQLMEARMSNNTPEQPDRMERRMAEFLVHRHVPWPAFLGVAAKDATRARAAGSALASVGVQATIRERPEWYFR